MSVLGFQESKEVLKKMGIIRNGVWREGKNRVFISKENYGSSK